MNSQNFELYFILSISSFFVGLSRGGLGGGFGLAAAVIAAQILEPIRAAAFLLPLLIISDPLSVWIYRKNIHWESLRVLLPGVIVGITLTYFLINFISNTAVSLTVGFLAIILVLDSFFNKLIKRPKKIIHPLLGAFLGVVGGFSSFIIHSGLPPIAMYLFPLSLSRQTFMGTVAVFFGITNIIKLIPYFILGLFDKEILRLTICFIPITFFGIFIGKLINNKISDKIFFSIIYITILILGMRLIWLSI